MWSELFTLDQRFGGEGATPTGSGHDLTSPISGSRRREQQNGCHRVICDTRFALSHCWTTITTFFLFFSQNTHLTCSLNCSVRYFALVTLV